MGYKKETVKGIGWMGALRIIVRGLTFIRLAILARLLTPFEFGLFGIASLALAFLEITTETGINIFFIQGGGKLKDFIDTAWVISIARGFLISILLILGAPRISIFFNSPNSSSLISFIALIPLLRGFINPSIIKFQKNLEFNKEFFLRTIIFFVESVVSIVLAFSLRGAVSLVWGLSAGVVVEVLLSHLIIKPRPRFSVDRFKFKKIIGRGKWVAASNIFQYLFTNIDSVVIGRLLSANSLGIYQMAYKISTLPITEISNVFYKVTFPIFSKFYRDKERLRKAFVKASLVLISIVIPLSLIIFFFAESIVLKVLGSNWLQVVEPLKILVIYGIIRASTAEFPAIFLAVKRQEYVAISTFFAVMGIVVTITPFIKKMGILGASYSMLCGMLVALPVLTICLRKVFKKI